MTPTRHVYGLGRIPYTVRCSPLITVELRRVQPEEKNWRWLIRNLCFAVVKVAAVKAEAIVDTFGLAAFGCTSFRSALQASPVDRLF